jgi:3'-phosphoadenosine 5'-phosphosulfate sulfotransferase (PAPS reductase)/FAD synthetase
MLDVQSAFARHRHIAFQFSGGRDSTVALDLIKPWWDRMTVYHLDAGDQFPETQRVVQEMARRVPIIRIRGDSRNTRAMYGLASDIVPVDNYEVGRSVSGRPVKIIGRYECCARSLMAPMHERMLADGISLIIRGQRDDEFAQPLTRSGFSDDRVELLFPIQDWTAERVMQYIAEHDLPIADYYRAGCSQAPECMGCTAWWSEGRAAYLKANYPAAHDVYQANLRTIRGEIDRQYQTLEGEAHHG